MTLQSEDMGKLVAGKSVLLLDGKLVTFSGLWTSVRGRPGIKHDGGSQFAHRYSYVGTLTPDGWIEGEWAENPVPGMRVEIEWEGDRLPGPSETYDWTMVSRFRPVHREADAIDERTGHPTSYAHREAQPETDGGGEASGMSELEWAVYTAAYSILRDYENHPLKDRGLINAGDQRIPKLIAAQVVEQMAALASKGV